MNVTNPSAICMFTTFTCLLISFFFLNSRLIYKLYVWAVKTITVLLQYHVMVQYLGIVCSIVYLVITLQLKGDKDRLVIFTS